MNKIRFRFSKTGKSMFISHLDLMSTLQRSFLRAGIKLKYSQGFNPHPYMSVALPLSVGCESTCELIDIALFEESVPDIKLLKFPEGISVTEAYISNRKFSDISWIEITADMHYDKQIDESSLKEIINDLKRNPNSISKRTKRGFKELDIAPYIKDAELSFDKSVLLKAKISAQNPTINIDDIEKVFRDELKPDCINLKRIEIYDSNMVIFR